MNVFVIGIGLIGGSLAKDIKSTQEDVTVYGIDSNDTHLAEAKDLGIIDKKASYQDLQLADMVIVSIPVDVMVKELPKILDAVHEDCVVFDVGSTKSLICKTLESHPKRRNFLACHPISGTEFSGPSAAIIQR